MRRYLLALVWPRRMGNAFGRRRPAKIMFNMHYKSVPSIQMIVHNIYITSATACQDSV